MKKYILISELAIHNANAMSSTITIGVPAMTAWLGAVHALERKINKSYEFEGVQFPCTTVSYLKTDLQVYKGPGDYANSIIGTANPLDDKGKRASFIEEPRIHLKVSLLIETEGLVGDCEDKFIEIFSKELYESKFAGGDVMDFERVRLVYSNGDVHDTRKIVSMLMPGFVVVERKDLLLDNSDEDALEQLLNYLAVYNTKEQHGGNAEWIKSKKESGWLVPIAVGFKRISEIGKIKGQRDKSKNHCFVEPVVTIGEFKMAYRFESIDDMMWHYEYKENEKLYLCVNQQ